MLKLRVTPYADTTWRWSHASYTTGDGVSEVIPYCHPMVEHFAVTDGTRTMIVVRERTSGRAAATPGLRRLSPEVYDRAVTMAMAWPLDYVVVETAQRTPVRVTAGPCGTAPVYLAVHNGHTLHGSWDMGDLRMLAGRLHVKEAARLLAYRPRYSTDTLFTGIHRLTERATATFGGHLYIRYPEPAPHVEPRELVPDADVLGAFVAAIDTALGARPIDPDTTVVHLTGGFDSGTVCTRAAQRYPGRLRTAALLIGGPGRQQQIRQRKEIRAAVPFADHDELVDAMVEAPLHPRCARVAGELVSPYEEPLHRPFAVLTGAVAAAGARVVITGIGGDEMVALSQEEYPHPIHGIISTWITPLARDALEYADDGIAPPAVVNSMTLLSLETTAPVLLRVGIWPVHPFTHPGMITLGESLPVDWRQVKQLQRRRLADLGLSDHVTRPVERESFAEVVEHSLTTYGPDLVGGMLAGGSPLFDAGLVDPDQLRRAMSEVAEGLYVEDVHSQLIEVIDLHLAAVAFG